MEKGIAPKDDVLVIGYDIGTTGAKTCLFSLGHQIELMARSVHEYSLQVVNGNGIEQNPDDWWRAMALGTADVIRQCGIRPSQVRALSFSAQMQSFVPVDTSGRSLRPSMSYMDQRGTVQQLRLLHRPPRISGISAALLLPSLHLTGGVSASVKDPVWKYLWMKDNEPELFARLAYWLDVKDYLAMRCTGRPTMTHDSANATFLYDTRQGKLRWSEWLCRAHGVERRHFPEVIGATDIVGPLSQEAARDLGLEEGIPVVGGGGDLTMQALGAGCVEAGDTHVYIGTSGWVSAVVKSRTLDINHFMASILGARPGHYNYIGEQETSGKCLEWVRDHIALDEIGIYLAKHHVAEDPDSEYSSLLDYLSQVISETPAGSGGVIFAPWLHGNRSPFEDPNARGILFNIGLDTGKRKLIRAVVEGIAFQKRWYLECMTPRIALREPLRFVGGGALSESVCRILADVTGRSLAVIENPQTAGAAGAATCCGLALGVFPDFPSVQSCIKVAKTYEPDRSLAEVYEKNYQAFRNLHPSNRKTFALLNAGSR